MGYSVRPEFELSFGLYWPDGVPDEKSSPASRIGYEDKEGEEFGVAYTADQVLANAERHSGVFWPYIPLYVTALLDTAMEDSRWKRMTRTVSTWIKNARGL